MFSDPLISNLTLKFWISNFFSPPLRLQVFEKQRKCRFLQPQTAITENSKIKFNSSVRTVSYLQICANCMFMGFLMPYLLRLKYCDFLPNGGILCRTAPYGALLSGQSRKHADLKCGTFTLFFALIRWGMPVFMVSISKGDRGGCKQLFFGRKLAKIVKNPLFRKKMRKIGKAWRPTGFGRCCHSWLGDTTISEN